MQLTVRIAIESDLPEMLAISNEAALRSPANFAVEPESLEAWRESWTRTHETHPWLVALDEVGRIVAFAKASPHRRRGAYAWAAEVTVYVHPEHHGRGIGSALYQQLIPMLERQGYRTLIAGITTPNEASERLHAAFGFRCIGRFERVGWKLDRWHDVAYWQLVLDDSDRPPAALRPVVQIELPRSDPRPSDPRTAESPPANPQSLIGPFPCV